MSKLIVFGSARMDAFMDLPDSKADQLCSIDEKNCFIQLSYAAKISMDNVEFKVGGNGANVAVGTKRLGVDSSLVAELGEGPLADYVQNTLGKEIDMNYVTQTSGINQGFGAVIVYQGERTILSYYSPKQPPFPDNIDSYSWAYLTSVGDKFDEFYEKVYEWLSKNDTKLVFNPGGRQINKGREWLGKYIARSELVISNREETEKIVGMTNTFGKEKDLIDAYSAMGPKVVILTDGMNGSFTKSDGNYYKCSIFPSDSIERTGAGDAFSSGVLASYINGKSLEEAMVVGTVNSASVVGFVGPEDGLLDQNSLTEWLERAKSSGVTVEKLT